MDIYIYGIKTPLCLSAAFLVCGQSLSWQNDEWHFWYKNGAKEMRVSSTFLVALGRADSFIAAPAAAVGAEQVGVAEIVPPVVIPAAVIILERYGQLRQVASPAAPLGALLLLLPTAAPLYAVSKC